MFSTRTLPSLLVLLGCALGAGAQGKTFNDRGAVPGNYFVGLFADARGTKSELILEPGQLEFDAYLGVGGDSTRVYSGLVLDMAFPHGIEADGPIKWSAIPGLSQEGILGQGGMTVEFSKQCVEYNGVTPTIVARVHFVVDDDFESGTIEVREHVKHGLSLELCIFDEAGQWWPKPFAKPVHLEVRRKETFWGRIRNFFHRGH